jgi:ABC-type transport system involved in cytochrome bd biosynthesis fused ATPase/permease subunit
MAIVPQDVALFNRTVMENLRYARPDAGDDDVAHAVETARCRSFCRWTSRRGSWPTTSSRSLTTSKISSLTRAV